VRVGPNEVLRLVLELAALLGAGLGASAIAGGGWPGILAGLVVAAVAALLWGLFRSPRARFPLPWPGRLLVEVAVMGAGAIGFAVAGQPVVAIVFGVLAVGSGSVNLVREERRARDR